MSSSSPGASPRRNARGEAKLRDILDAALRVVGERGVSGVTHRAVGNAAGISSGLVTYYFASVDELLEATLRAFVDEESDRLRAATKTLADADPEADHASIVGAVLQALGTDPAYQIAQFELYLEAARRPALRDAARACIAAYGELAEQTFVQLGSPRASEGARTLVALLDGLALHRLLSSDDDAFVLELALPAILAVVATYAPNTVSPQP